MASEVLAQRVLSQGYVSGLTGAQLSQGGGERLDWPGDQVKYVQP